MSAANPPTRRALILSVSKRYGGVDVRVEQLARGLHERRRPYAVAVMRDSELHRRLVADGLNAVPLAAGRASPALAGEIRRLSRVPGTVIDAHQVQTQFWMLLARAVGRRPMAVTVHSDYASEQRGRGPRELIYPRVPLLAAWGGARVIAVSESVRESLLRSGIRDERIEVITNGIADPGPVTPLTFDGWPGDAHVVVASGRLEPVKGFDLLIDAVARVADRLPALRVAIAGEGRARVALERRIADRGLADRVRLLGFREDMPAVLAAASAFCMPSRTEGLPYALLEAGVAGLPVVASRVGGLAALLDHGETAFLSDPESSESIAEGLLWSAGPTARRSAEAFAAQVRQRFGVERMVEQTCALYDAL